MGLRLGVSVVAGAPLSEELANWCTSASKKYSEIGVDVARNPKSGLHVTLLRSKSRPQLSELIRNYIPVTKAPNHNLIVHPLGVDLGKDGKLRCFVKVANLNTFRSYLIGVQEEYFSKFNYKLRIHTTHWITLGVVIENSNYACSILSNLDFSTGDQSFPERVRVVSYSDRCFQKFTIRSEG